VAVLIPSIDLMGGKIVQLVQGQHKALEFDNFEYWIGRFTKYPMVQLIDLDAARGAGENQERVRQIVTRLKCQVGGGVRSIDAARRLLDLGAARVIIGSALLSDGKINRGAAAALSNALGPERLVFALDSRGGRVAVDGWRQETMVTAFDMIRELEQFCGAFLYTHIDSEGLMGGIPIKTVKAIARATSRRLIAAGGIRTKEEIEMLDASGIDAVVGMALYSGKLAG
jgi:phosphoribosylformimino-5-aminoimidazole carboxamide ribotide isomerase